MNTRTIKVPKHLSRSGFMTEETEDGKKSLRVSISSSEPYLRYDWMEGKEYFEVLSHEPGGIDETRLKQGLPVLFNHSRDSHLGRSTTYRNDGKRMDVGTLEDIKWSESTFAQEKKRDVENGSLVGTSVGYSITGEGKQIGTRDGKPILRFNWAPHEFSFCTIEADTTVGAGRQRAAEEAEPMQEIDVHVDSPANANAHRTNMETPPVNPEVRIDVKEVASQAVETERKRTAGIRELDTHFRTAGLAGRKIDTRELADKFISDGKSQAEFQDAVVRGNFKEVAPVVTDGKVGMDKRDLSKYSIVRAISRAASGKFDGLEAECSKAHADKTGQDLQERGFFIPQDVLEHGSRESMKRALFAGTFSAAGALVPDELLAGSMIELLRNKMAVMALGARSLSGLQGNVQIPLQSGGATASWLAEDATISATSQTVGQLTLVPHRLGAATAYTYQLLAQSSVDVENFVREDLMRVLAIAKDLAAIAGTGVSGQPEGILNTSNLSTSVTLSNAQTMIYSDTLTFENNVALNNADLGKLAYLTTPTVRKNAKAVAEISAANSNPVWKNDMVNGYRAFASNQVPTATSVIFGNWDDLIIADWAGQQVIVDPYSLSMAGQVRIVVQQLCDNGLRHTKSFCVSTN